MHIVPYDGPAGIERPCGTLIPVFSGQPIPIPRRGARLRREVRVLPPVNTERVEIVFQGWRATSERAWRTKDPRHPRRVASERARHARGSRHPAGQHGARGDAKTRRLFLKVGARSTRAALGAWRPNGPGAGTAATSVALPHDAARFHFGTVAREGRDVLRPRPFYMYASTRQIPQSVDSATKHGIFLHNKRKDRKGFANFASEFFASFALKEGVRDVLTLRTQRQRKENRESLRPLRPLRPPYLIAEAISRFWQWMRFYYALKSQASVRRGLSAGRPNGPGAGTAATSAALPCGGVRFHFGTVAREGRNILRPRRMRPLQARKHRPSARRTRFPPRTAAR